MASSSASSFSAAPGSFEPRNQQDGSANPKFVDILDEDKPVAGQKFVCLSFVSPEKVLKQKDQFFFQEFLKQWELSVSMEKYTQFMSFLSYKYNLKFDQLTEDLQEFCKEEKDKLFATLTLEDRYKSYIDAHETELEEEFAKQHSFQTTVRGVKVRGVYPTVEEAELRCKMLREVDPNHDVYVGPVGVWMPFHPEAYKTGRVEYLEDELNQLMHEKQHNEQFAKQEFDKRVRETKEKAIQENIRKAKESGNVLTQTITEDGQLVSVTEANTPVTVGDIRRELFEGDNVVTDRNTDHGLSRIEEVRELPTDKAETEAVAVAVADADADAAKE